MELQIFKNAELGSVRSTMINGEPYFVCKDVAEILGYADPNKSIAMHVDEDDKLNDKSASSLGQRGGWFINESGLYRLAMTLCQVLLNNLFNKIFRNCCLVLHKCSSENNTVSIINSSVYFVNELEKVVHVCYTCVCVNR